ncbi:MAG: 16S rRNA (uracil(1498)-N(3))-methyltransferase [Pyrinomonadaceae bacterium]
MTRRRFFAPPGAFDANAKIVSLAGDESRHLRDVLRLSRGDEVFVFDGQGHEYQCVVDDFGRDSSTLRLIDEVEPASPESPLKLTLAVALLKGEKFDLLVQKATELGVLRVVPVITTRADVRLRDSADAQKRVMRWQRIALEAAKQSGRALVPEVSSPTDFASLLVDQKIAGARRIMFSEKGGTPLQETPLTGPPADITALVGSEGGWADEELAQARNAGWRIVTLGGRTMRAETAAIAVTVVLQHLYGDLK